MKSFTQSAIAAKSIDEFNSDGSFIENLKSLLIYLALIIYVAKATNISSLFDKLLKYTRQPPLVSVHDKPVHRRRSVLESVQDKPLHKRQRTLVSTQDAPISRRTSNSSCDSSSSNHTIVESMDDAFGSFCQENREYVKNWKEERVNRQLFEMWHELGKEGQEEWVNKADALDKLFEATDNTKVYKSIVTPKLRKTDAELCKQITGYDSALLYFKSEMANFTSFIQQYIAKDPYKPPTVDINTWTTQVCNDTNYVKKVLTEWIQAGDHSQKTRYKQLQMKTITLVSNTARGGGIYTSGLWNVIGSDGQRLWEDAYDSMVHAYELFCQKVRRTDPEMSDDVDEHLSRMWESLEEDKASNTGYAYFCGCNRDATNPDLNFSQMWKALSKNERKKWAKSAELL